MEASTTAQRTLNATTVAVASILANPRLSIPHYQRPYKWQQHIMLSQAEDWNTKPVHSIESHNQMVMELLENNRP